MKAGGVVSKCTERDIYKSADYDGDGKGDMLEREDCQSFGNDYYVRLSQQFSPALMASGSDGEPIPLNQEREVIEWKPERNPLAQGFRQFRFDSNHPIQVRQLKSDTSFSLFDIVEVPFSATSDTPQNATIAAFVLEFDPKNNFVRTVAEVRTSSGIDYFDLSALTFLSPAAHGLPRAERDPPY